MNVDDHSDLHAMENKLKTFHQLIIAEFRTEINLNRFQFNKKEKLVHTR